MKLAQTNKWIISSIFVILVVGLVTYQPSLGIGFWRDDYWFIDNAGRLDWATFLNTYANPSAQSLVYRPFQGVQWKIEYMFFGGEPVWYHLAQIAFYLVNCLLLYILLFRFTRDWRLAFPSVLLYVGMPVYAQAVFWLGVTDPFLGMFYLSSVYFWIDYLQTGKRSSYFGALLALVTALLTKETSVTLLPILFLADRLLINQPLSIRQALQRYAPFLLAWLVYVFVELPIARSSDFVKASGYSISATIIVVAWRFLSFFMFPWGTESFLSYFWLGGILIAIYFAMMHRDRRAFFFIAAPAIMLLPVLSFPLNFASPRYLYLPMMPVASAVGLTCGSSLRSFRLTRRAPASLLGLTLISTAVLVSGLMTGESAVNMAGDARLIRLKFRPIFQKHSSFNKDTLLYFIDPPIETSFINGLVFLRYGKNVSVSGTDHSSPPRLRDYHDSFVYYSDDADQLTEQKVDQIGRINLFPMTPLQFSDSLALEQVEVVSPKVPRGERAIFLLYWKRIGKLDREYTVFAHLVNANGVEIDGYDRPFGQPGASPIPWGNGDFGVTAVFLPIGSDVPIGEYRIEIGLYDSMTQQRILILDAQGRSFDKIVLHPITAE